MRSLTLTRAQSTAIKDVDGSKTGAMAVDPEQGTIYVGVERKGDMGLEVDIVAITPGLDTGTVQEVRHMPRH
jgi:elongator complex protein 1